MVFLQENAPNSSTELPKPEEKQAKAVLGRIAFVGLFKKAVLFLFFVFLAIVLYLYYSTISEIIFTSILNGQSFADLLPVIRTVLFLFAGTWVFLQVTKYLISRYLENKGKKKEIKLILTLYSYVVWSLLAILVASTIFKDIGLFLASLGLIGFGLTFALQKPILNFVGWLTIVVNKPFNIGDRIEVSNIRGDVLAIHSMYTSIQGTRSDSHDKSEKIISIPNESILSNPVINFTKKADLFWDEANIQVTFESNWQKAEKILFDVTLLVMKKYVTMPLNSVRKDKKSFDDALRLLEGASKKLSKGFLKQSIKDQIETMKVIEGKANEEIPVPNVRVDIKDSGIGLNVVYLADIRNIRAMKNEIARGFLLEADKHKDIEIAYPHTQVVFSGKTKPSAKEFKKMADFF